MDFISSAPLSDSTFSLARRLTAAQVRAFGAVQTATLDLAELPPNAVVKRILCVVAGAAAGVTTLLFSLGYDPNSPYQEYFNQHDLLNDAAGAVFGTAPSLSSENIPCAAIPSVTTMTPLKVVLQASTGAETLDAVTGLDMSIYFEAVVLP